MLEMWREKLKKKFLKQVVIFKVKGGRLVQTLRISLGTLKTVNAADARITLANGYKNIKNIVPRKRFRENHYHHKKITLKIVCDVIGWKLFKDVVWFWKCAYVCDSKISSRNFGLENIYNIYNAVEKHLVVDGKYKTRVKSAGQISSKTEYCKKLTNFCILNGIVILFFGTIGINILWSLVVNHTECSLSFQKVASTIFKQDRFLLNLLMSVFLKCLHFLINLYIFWTRIKFSTCLCSYKNKQRDKKDI